eukprot:s2619_g4.t1
MVPAVPPEALNWPRTKRRVVSMLFQAIPKKVHEELIANRRMSADQFRYQPAGQDERSSLLQLLVDWKLNSVKAADHFEAIRNWRRWLIRAQELQVVLPDPFL